MRFAVTNNGTAPGAINSVSVVTTGTQFTLASLPILPVNIGPGETVSFTIDLRSHNRRNRHRDSQDR